MAVSLNLSLVANTDFPVFIIENYHGNEVLGDNSKVFFLQHML